MSTQKLSALGAVTSTADESLLYVSDTTDSGSNYNGKRITKANLLSGLATESYVATQISNLVDSAPGALDTLNELAAALGDDASFSSTITNLINANEAHIDNAATLTGVAKDSTSLGTFTGSTLADNVTIKAALQALESAVEAAGSASSLAAVVTDASDLQTLTGVSDGNSDLGTFSGSTIADTSDIKTALQALETALETQTTAVNGKVTSGANVNGLVGSTTADTAPSDFYFLVVDSSTGAIKAVDKNYLEID